MAYGEDGATIDDTPRQLRRPLREQKPEPEVDRFDEGTYLWCFERGQTTSNALSVDVSQACKILIAQDVGKAMAIEKLKIFQNKTKQVTKHLPENHFTSEHSFLLKKISK